MQRTEATQENKKTVILPAAAAAAAVAAAAAAAKSLQSHPTLCDPIDGSPSGSPMPEGQRPRGVTPRPRSGAAAESARL